MQIIPKKITVESIELLYKKLYDSNDSFDLLLPNSITSFDFGINTLLIQYIVTWFRLKSGKIILEVKDDYSDLENIVNQDYVFPSIVMTWDRGIFDLKGNNIKKNIRPFNEKIIERMQSLENAPLFNKTFKKQKGMKSLLTCFDHLPIEKGHLDCFYTNDSFIPSEEYLLNSLEDTLNYVISLNVKGKENFKHIKNDLVSIIFELMKNTHDWARSDNNSTSLNPNTRGILIKFIRGGKSNFIDNYKNHKGLKSYFDSLEENSNNELYFVEISVFDSGIGLVRKYTSSDLKIDLFEQVNIIKKCLVKNNTSDKSLEKENKGIGLDKIMNVLNHNGLFMIRTSEVFVYRNMKRNPYVITKNENDIELFDWQSSLNDKFNLHKHSEGTNITIVYPIKINNE